MGDKRWPGTNYDKIDERIKRLREYISTCPDWYTLTRLERDLEALEELLVPKIKVEEDSWTH